MCCYATHACTASSTTNICPKIPDLDHMRRTPCGTACAVLSAMPQPQIEIREF